MAEDKKLVIRRLPNDPIIVDREQLSDEWHRTFASGGYCGERILRPLPGVPHGNRYFNVRVKFPNPEKDERSYFEDIGPISEWKMNHSFGIAQHFADMEIYLVNGELYQKAVSGAGRQGGPDVSLIALRTDTKPDILDAAKYGIY